MKTLTTKKINPVRDKSLSGGNTIPLGLQGILWSADVRNLDLEENKNYIIHQILMYGDLKEIAWLFKVYSKKEVKRVFKKSPMRIYSPQGFYFIKNVILNLKKNPLPPEKYVASLY